MQDTYCALQPGGIVQLLQGHPQFALQAGDQDCVWGCYDAEPPQYEADFYQKDGTGIARLFSPEDMEPVTDKEDVRIPPSVLDWWKRASNPEEEPSRNALPLLPT
ncbi:MAG: hypothetical protein V4671_12055 [Armatimonadota bacterium]